MPAELNFTVDQTDNGKYINFVDTSTWDNPADTGVTNIKIEIEGNNGISYITIQQSYSTVKPQNSLNFLIPITDFGYSTALAPVDGAYKITYTVAGTGLSGVLIKDVLLDYNSKFFIYTLFKELPYKFPLGMKWNADIQEAVIGDVLLTAMEYAADVGQVQKMDDFLEAINMYKLKING